MSENRNIWGKLKSVGAAWSFGHFSLLIILAAILFTSTPGSVSAAGTNVEVFIFSSPPMPAPVEEELQALFLSTLSEVLVSEDQPRNILESNIEEIAEAIRDGVNIVIEPRGYYVYQLGLTSAEDSIQADFYVHPYGWTSEDPHAVTMVDLVISEEAQSDFWLDQFNRRLEANQRVDGPTILQILESRLIGLPVYAQLDDWALNLVLNDQIVTDLLQPLYPSCDIDWSVELGPTAIITLNLSYSRNVIELIRPRMYSNTLYNAILDRFRERLLVEADDLLIGLPREEIAPASDEIEERLAEALDRDKMAGHLNTYSKVNITLPEEEPVVVVDAQIESKSYDMVLETFVDFGNEANDSTEVQARFGLLLERQFEIFTNLNYFTNDSTLNTDIGFGIRPTGTTFVAFGYDLKDEETKYFLTHDFARGFELRGEVFEDETKNEFGLTYQFQQYLSGGFFTNADNEYWMRAIFSL